MRYPLEKKIRILDRIENETMVSVAEDEGVTRRSISNWREQEDELRDEWRLQQVKDEVALDTSDDLGVVSQREKDYLARLDSLGELEERKKVFVAGLEKVMWDHLDALDQQRFDEIKPDVRVKMLKDMNEIREKLSGEPSVIMEYRYKFQMLVMEVVKDMIPERAEEFLDKVKRLEGEIGG